MKLLVINLALIFIIYNLDQFMVVFHAQTRSLKLNYEPVYLIQRQKRINIYKSAIKNIHSTAPLALPLCMRLINISQINSLSMEQNTIHTYTHTQFIAPPLITLAAIQDGRNVCRVCSRYILYVQCVLE